MAKVIVNLTLPTVMQVIEDILELYPAYPYREVFACPDTRQELVAYVLSRFPSTYAAVPSQMEGRLEGDRDCGTIVHPFLHAAALSSLNPSFSAEQRLKLETLVHQGIHYLTTAHAADLQHHASADSLSCHASDWFG